MEVHLMTKDDFMDLKSDLIEEIRRIISPVQNDNEWLKSKEVMDLLKCSPGSLQNLRVSGALPFSKIGGTIYYSKKDIMRLLNKN